MSFHRYEGYKASGIEALGDVPSHWTIVRLKHVASMKGRLGWQGLRADEYTEEGPFLVTSEHFVDGAVDWGRCYHVTHDRYAMAPEIQLQPHDVLMMKDGAAMGKLAYVDAVPRPACLNSHLLLFRPRAGRFHSRFLYYVLGAPVFTDYMVRERTGTTFFGISQQSVGDFSFSLPPLSEQVDIVRTLDAETAKIRTLIDAQSRLIDLLNEKRQAVISQAVTRGLNSRVSLKPSGIAWLAQVPAHWRVMSLKRIADVQTGVAKGKDNAGRDTINVPYLRVANVQDGYLDLTEVASIDIPVGDLERYKLRVGDVLMNEGGDFDKLGRGSVWNGEIEPCISQNHVFAVRPRSVSSAWLNAIIGSDYAQFYFMSRSKQSTNLASISSTNLMQLPVLLPPEPEQEAILSFIEKEVRQFDALTAEARCAIDLLEERRAALISAAVTGQIDVRGLGDRELAATS